MRQLETFKYSALSKDGIKVNGVIEALDEYAAVDKIKSSCPIVLKIQPISPSKRWLDTEIGTRFKPKVLSLMCSQFATILGAGVDVESCVLMVANQTKDKKIKQMLEKTAKDIADGNRIATSFEVNCPNIPVTFVETIRAGELSSNLEESFRTLESYYERTYKIKEKLKQALTYPIFVLVIAVIVLMIVMVQVVPTLTNVFRDLHGQLPGITVFLIKSSDFFARSWPTMVISILLLLIVLQAYHHTEKGRLHWHAKKLTIPVLGKINSCSGCSDFASTLSTLLIAGLPLPKALEVTSKVMDNYIMQKEIRMMQSKVEVGYKLGDLLSESKSFPSTLAEMVAVGEETGELENTLQTVGLYYSNEANYYMNLAITRLEPTLLILLAIFAGFIVIAIYLPMFTMYGLM